MKFRIKRLGKSKTNEKLLISFKKLRIVAFNLFLYFILFT